MFPNFLKIAVRNLWKRKMISGINLSGLGIAMGIGLLLFLTALHEFSYDRFHAGGERIYRVYYESFPATGVQRQANLQVPLQPVLKDEIPELEGVTRWQTAGAAIYYKGKTFNESIRYVDPDFFRIFSFPVLKGSPADLLRDPNQAVLVKKAADRIFAGEDPMGKTLTLMQNGMQLDLTVAGILENEPDNSSLEPGILIRFEQSPQFERSKDSWDNFSHDVYIRTAPHSAQADVEKKLRSITEKYMADQIELVKNNGGQPNAAGEYVRYGLQPLSDLHFNTAVKGSAVRKAFPIGLMVIGIFILSIACFNFVNLTIGASLARAREVGVRKVLGAAKRQIVWQFFGEALLLVGLGLGFGIVLADWLLPRYNATFNLDFDLEPGHLALASALILLVAGGFGGLIPAIAFSRFETIKALKGLSTVHKRSGMRNGLILLQFTFSILLICCTLIVGRQLNFLRNQPLGYNAEEVISIPLSSKVNTRQTIERLRGELAGNPDVVEVSASYYNLGTGRDGSQLTSKMTFTQEGESMFAHWSPVHYGFFEALDIKMLEGRSFSREHPTDTAEAVIINETLARQLGAGPMVGKMLEITEPPRTIIGVVRDFHFKSLQEKIEPFAIVLGTDGDFRFNYAFVRVKNQNPAETLVMLENTWKTVAPGIAFNASFLDENTNRQYQGERVMARIFMIASGIAIFLSCLGLFGVVMQVVGARIKEIGVRKVLGASIGQINGLIARNFLLLVGGAMFIASPLAWLAMEQYLQIYAYRTDIPIWIFLAGGGLAGMIALVTISIQTIRAGLANPVEALRSE